MTYAEQILAIAPEMPVQLNGGAESAPVQPDAVQFDPEDNVSPESQSDEGDSERVDWGVAETLLERSEFVADVETLGDMWKVSFNWEMVRTYNLNLVNRDQFAAMAIARMAQYAISPEADTDTGVGDMFAAARELVESGRIPYRTTVPSDLTWFRGDTLDFYFEPNTMELLRSTLGREYTAQATEDREEFAVNEYIQGILAYYAGILPELAPLFDEEFMAARGLSPGPLSAALANPTIRRQFAAILTETFPDVLTSSMAEGHQDAGFDHLEAYGSLITGRTPEPADYDVLTRQHWARIIVWLEAQRRAFLAQQEQQTVVRVSQERESYRLEPHPVNVESQVRFPLERVNPNAEHTVVDGWGEYTLRGDMMISLSDSRVLHLLDVWPTAVLYQDQSDYQYYRQSMAGFERDLQESVLADAGYAARAMPVLGEQVVQVLVDVFEPLRLPMFAATVFQVAVGVGTNWEAALAHWMMGGSAQRWISENCPGLIFAIIAAELEDDLLELVNIGYFPSLSGWISVASRRLGDRLFPLATNPRGFWRSLGRWWGRLTRRITIATRVLGAVMGGITLELDLENGADAIKMRLIEQGMQPDHAEQVSRALVDGRFSDIEQLVSEVSTFGTAASELGRIIERMSS